ncbi:MAG: glutamate racemase [Leptothrix ochracea]|uniref:glutamate racemase n=1 Tax=Leptothrix ochracea TaxID=735331 RepID=UPI0034E198C2
MTRPTCPHPARFGVFDSGLGGLSVLKALRQRLPASELIYVADSGHAPYGERSDAFIQQRSEVVARFLVEQQIDVLVIACNTATAVAAQSLRAQWPDLPVVGVEPGLKPAVAQSAQGRVGVLATEGTLRSEKFQRLAASFADQATLVLQACPGLAGAIEAGDVDALAVRERVEACCAPLRQQQVDTVVLGCTHYPFVAHHIQAALGSHVTLIDTAEAVARQAERLHLAMPAKGHSSSRSSNARTAWGALAVQLYTSGSVTGLRDIANRWLDFDCEVSMLPMPR